MQQGNVKWFNNEKVMALLNVTMEKMYLYILRIQEEGFRTLEEGQKVSFDVVEGNRGPQASNVMKL